MEKFVCTFAMCILTSILFAQERTQTNESLKVSKVSVVDSVGKPLKPTYVDTGNPTEDQKRYQESKAAYYKAVSEQSSVSTGSPRTRSVVEADIKQVDSHMNSIKIKREHILKNPEATEEAKRSGWFEDMKATEERLEKKKASLEQELNNL